LGAIAVILQTERMSLHELERSDAPFVLDLLMSRGFIDNIGDRGIRDVAGAEGYIERVQASYAANGFGLWRCDVKAGGAAAGLCGLVKRDGLEHPDIGYAFLEAFWGRGYATEAATTCVAYGRDVLGLTTIVAITAPHNLASIAVLKKLGLHAAGLIHLPGIDEDSCYFST
jgi:ribosomal-protein-alanine N-acetyltransferase